MGVPRIRIVVVLVALLCAVLAGASPATVAARPANGAAAPAGAVQPHQDGKRWN
jgi:hypothetical protein